MSLQRRESTHLRVVPDTPLPGFYSVLTLQINVTRYQAAHMGKWVLVVREPSAQHELFRSFVDVSEWAEAVEELPEAIRQALHEMRFLQEGYRHQEP